jgi:glycosyltransferase involved in cell wall biosynthesis
MIISIITVCYNSSNTIADTLISLSNQNYADIEHIIVDGGSIDATLEIIKNNQLPNSKIISEKDDGIYDAMNKGLSLATGEVIGFINSDDFYPTSDVLALVANIFGDTSIDCCYGDLCYVDQSNSEKVVRYWRSGPFIPNSFRN